MKARQLYEAGVEAAALDTLESLGYASLRGGDVAPGEPAAERGSFSKVALRDRLRESLRRLNPDLPAEALEEAFGKAAVPRSIRCSRITGPSTACW